MQIWQLFHILEEYCNITKESSSLYCNMIKYLLQNKKIHGSQTIEELTMIDLHDWRTFFQGSLYSLYNVDKLKKILLTIHEYISTNGIVSVIAESNRKTERSYNQSKTHNQAMIDIISKTKKRLASNTSSKVNIGTISVSLSAGFLLGCLYTWSRLK